MIIQISRRIVANKKYKLVLVYARALKTSAGDSFAVTFQQNTMRSIRNCRSS